MTTTREAPTCPFNHRTAEFKRDYIGAFDRLREMGALVWSTEFGGFWVVTKHETGRRMLTEMSEWLVVQDGLLVPPSPGVERRPRFVPGEADGEEHDRYRAALNPFFAKRRVEDMVATIDEHVERAYQRVMELGDFDVAKDLAAPITHAVVIDKLGLSVPDVPAFYRDCFAMVGDQAPEDTDTYAERFEAAWPYIIEAVSDRRREPKDDLISELVTHEAVFTDDEVQLMTLNVILGGADTVTTLITHSLVRLQREDDLRQTLINDPSIIERSMDEFIRMADVSMGTARVATKDLEVDGVTIRAGDRILMAYPAMNHDPEKFSDPNVFSLERGGRGQLGMSIGTHHCLGAWLAKKITSKVIEMVLTRLPELVIHEDRIQYSDPNLSPIRFERAPASIETDSNNV